MKIGFIGLGKMGSNMVARLLQDKHEVVAFDPNPEAVRSVVDQGAEPAQDLEDMLRKLSDLAVLWLMIPSSAVDDELQQIFALAPAGTIIVDGGNSDFRLTQRRAAEAREHSMQLVDVGTSGGILGAQMGYSMMVGGDDTAVAQVEPFVRTLAPEHGWNHFGPTGSGHYVKMVHNAIEYGLMQSYAEGYRMLKEGPIPDIDLAAAGEVWQHGSIIQSLLNQLTAEALSEDSELADIEGYVQESGETRWALEVAQEHGLDMPAVEAAFDVRVKSQEGQQNYATKLLAVMRNKFGGHDVKKR